MLFLRSLMPGWGILRSLWPADIFRWLLGLDRGDDPGREPRLKAEDSEFPKLPFRPLPSPISPEVGEGLRARTTRGLKGSSVGDPAFRRSLGLSGTILGHGLSGVRRVPGRAPGSTGTPLRAIEGLRGGSSLMLLPSRFLRASRGLSGGCSVRGCGCGGPPWMMWTMGSKGGWKDREGGESCWEGLDAKERSGWGCSRKGLEGRSWRTMAVLVLGLEGEEDGDAVENLGENLGLPGTGTRLTDGASVGAVEMETEGRMWVCMGLSGVLATELSWFNPLRLGFGLGGASKRAFRWSLGLSGTFGPLLPPE